jgi:hypothetical protein
MRKQFDLNLRALDRLLVLVHGEYGSGKTHLLGDFLRTEAVHGPVAFINVAGEDGYMSLANFGLGMAGETVETVDDFNSAVLDLRTKGKPRAVGVDSLKWLLRAAIVKVCGPNRLPEISKTKNDWPAIHKLMEDMVVSLRNVAPFVMCVCPSDKSINQITGELMLTPDLPGRQAVGSAGWFDLVGLLRAETLNGGKVKRVLRVSPLPGIVTRQRFPTAIIEDIVLPEKEGGWLAIRERINAALVS